MGTMPALTPGQYDLVYNMLSLGLASMAASTVFFFLRLGSFAERYKAALCFTGLVTFIAMYHYFRIFESFNKAYTPCKLMDDGSINYNMCNADEYGYTATGIAFNDAYRYVDWLLAVPLLLIEIVLVMKLSEAETFSRCCTLGVSSALMIANGYPGETSGDPMTRWCFWALSMAPFCYIVYTLFVGLKESQEASQRSAVSKSSGHAGQLCSRGAHTLSSTPSQCLLVLPVARVVSLHKPWSPSRSGTPCLMSSPSVVSATSCTASVLPSP